MAVATEDEAAMAAAEDVMEAVGTAAGVGAIGAEATGVMKAVIVDMAAAVATEVAEGAKAATAVTAAALTRRAHRF